MSTIKVSGLTKDYGNQKGVFDLNFEIQKGEVFGYLGPNGAGKTTTIRHLLGFLNVDKGNCTIGGLDCRTQSAEICESLGYLPGEIAFFDHMTGTEYLNFIAKMHNLTDHTKMKELITKFELDPSGKLKRMSKGMKQKIGIVSAFMHNPSTLILDEPTSGLDPLMQNRFINLVVEEKEAGKTILMSSHSFEEVERTCDRVGIIKAGKLVTCESVKSLKKAQRKIFRITFNSKEDAQNFAKEPLEIQTMSDHHVNVVVSGELKPLTAALDRYPISGLDVVSQSLEEIFMGYYGGNSDV